MKHKTFIIAAIISGILVAAGIAVYFVLNQQTLSPNQMTVSLDEEFTLTKGETARVDDLNVFLKVQDFIYSPCPQDAQCIWIGQAVVFDLTVDGKVYTAPLGYLSLDAPYTVKIKKTDYQTYATFVINTPPRTQEETTNTNIITFPDSWIQAQFPQTDYHHSVNIMLPSTWKFDCCGDTDSFSAHSIYPTSSENNLETTPYITVYDFALFGCPNGEYGNCSIDQLQKVTPQQYMTSVTNYLNESGEAPGFLSGFTSLKKNGTVQLPHFGTNAIIYSGISPSHKFAALYIFQSSKGVIGVVFQQSQIFDPIFITEFLNRITLNES